MTGYVMEFEFLTTDRTTFIKKVACYSKQIGWVQAASFVACHTLNPPVIGIKLIATYVIAKPVVNSDQECDEAYAMYALKHM